MKNRIIALMLAISLLFGFSSCKDGADEIPPKDKELTVEVEAVEYTDEEIEKISVDFADVAVEIAPILDYPTINDKNRAELASTFKSDIIPIIKGVPVYANELSELIACAHAVATVYSEETDGDQRLEFFSALYIEFCAILDTDRLGALLYGLQMYGMENSLARAQKNYDKYGHGYYLDDIEHYSALLTDARALGEEAYSDAISVLMFMISASLGSISSKDGIVSVAAGDLLVIMKKQGEKFASLELTEGEWQTVGGMCEELIPDSASSALDGKLLWVLDDENFFTESAVIMPELIELYAEITSDISEDNIEIIESGDELSAARVICGELAKDTESLSAFLSKLEASVPSASDAAVNIINIYDGAGYSAFLEDFSADRAALIAGIETFAAEPTDVNYAALEQLIIGYAATVNSAVAYVYLYL